MNVTDILKNWDVKLLSLVLAVSLWLGVAGGRDGELVVRIPLELRNIPAGYTVVDKGPNDLVVTLSGPNILLLKLRGEKIIIPLDMTGVGAGTVLFTGFETRLTVPSKVRVTRVFPAEIAVRVEQSPSRTESPKSYESR